MLAKTRRKIVGLAVIVIVAVIACAVFMFSRTGKTRQDRKVETIKSLTFESKRRQTANVNREYKPKPALATRRAGARGALEVTEEAAEDEMTPEDRKLANAIEKARDDADIESARGLATQALSSTNTEIRQSMVDTLGWFGANALAELTPFLVDPDEDVRDSAKNEWSIAVSEIENESDKVSVVELAMHVLKDEDALEEMSNEYIGIDEKLAVESLLRIIESEGSPEGIAKAKETYEFVTGEEFTDRTAAEKWIAEEYEPNP